MNQQSNINNGASAIHSQISQFLGLLTSADIVVVDSPALTSWETTAVIGQPDNQIVRFSWVGDEGERYGVILTEEGVADGKWVGESFFCNDHEGEEVRISLYTQVSLTPASLAKASGTSARTPVSSIVAAVPYLAQVDDVVQVLREHAVRIHDARGRSLEGLAFDLFDDLHLDAISFAAASLGSDDESKRREAVAEEIAQQLVDLGVMKGGARALRVNVVLTTGNQIDDRYGLRGLYEVHFTDEPSGLTPGQRAALAVEVLNASTQVKDYEGLSVSVIDPAGYVVELESVALKGSGTSRKVGEAVLHPLKRAEWTASMQKSALAEGWDVIDCDGSANGQWQVCRNENPEAAQMILADDTVAWKLVMEGVKPHHEAAREFIRQKNPLEWAAMSREIAA